MTSNEQVAAIRELLIYEANINRKASGAWYVYADISVVRKMEDGRPQCKRVDGVKYPGQTPSQAIGRFWRAITSAKNVCVLRDKMRKECPSGGRCVRWTSKKWEVHPDARAIEQGIELVWADYTYTQAVKVVRQAKKGVKKAQKDRAKLATKGSSTGGGD